MSDTVDDERKAQLQVGARRLRAMLIVAHAMESELATRNPPAWMEGTKMPNAGAYHLAHSTRLLDRLTTYGMDSPKLVRMYEGVDSGSLLAALDDIYFRMADLARCCTDLSTAWIAELNRVELHDFCS